MDNKGFIYFKIIKGTYGLKQAAILAYNQLKTNLAKHGYFPIPHTVGMWKHRTRQTKFCLCVDDFGIQYHSKNDADHLIQALQEFYKITIDWTGAHYCGLTLDWNYSKQYVDVSMPGYINNLLSRLKHKKPSKPVDAPHKWVVKRYGKHPQLTPLPDSSPPLSSKETGILQSTVGSLLFYSRAVDPSMLPGLNQISTKQSKPTQTTRKNVDHLLNYVATHPNAVLRYHASDMVLHVDSDAAYLVLPQARSRIAGHYYLSNDPTYTKTIQPNGPILTECRSLKHVVASAAEAETSALFHNAQNALPLRYLLSQLGHPQPPTPLKTDNQVANAFVHQAMRLKKSKAWDMRLWWLKDQLVQQHFRMFWEKGATNWADYFTKHFSPQYHRLICPHYIQRTNLAIATAVTKTLPMILQGCVGTPVPRAHA